VAAQADLKEQKARRVLKVHKVMLALRVLKVPLVLKVLGLKAAKAHQVLLVPKGT
jgi:hypothetical protein